MSSTTKSSSSTGRKTYTRSSKVEAEQKIKVSSRAEAKERLKNKRKRDSDDDDADEETDVSEEEEKERDFEPSDSEDDEHDADTKRKGNTDKWSGGETSDSEGEDAKENDSESDVEEEPYDSVLFTSAREQTESKNTKKASKNNSTSARGRPKRVVTSILKTSLGSGDSDDEDEDAKEDDVDNDNGNDNVSVQDQDLDVETGIVTRRRLAKKAKLDDKIASLGEDDSSVDILDSKRDKNGRIKYRHANWTKQNANKLRRLIKETTSLYKSYTSSAIEWSSMQTWSPTESELKRMAKKAADFKQEYIDKRAEQIQHMPFKAQRVYLELDRCTEKRNELRCVLPITDVSVKNMNERIVKLFKEKKECVKQLCKVKKTKKTAESSSDNELAKVLVKKYSSLEF